MYVLRYSKLRSKAARVAVDQANSIPDLEPNSLPAERLERWTAAAQAGTVSA